MKAALLSLTLLPVSAHAAVYFGEVRDPAGDAHRSVGDPSTDPAPDLIYGSASAADGSLVLSVSYAPGTFADDTYTQFILDTDQDPATGYAAFDPSIGVELIVNVPGARFGDSASLLVYSGSPNVFTFVASAAVSRRSDGVDVTIPLALIGDDGGLNFKIGAQVQITSSSWYGVSDLMTDRFAAPGTTVSPAQEIGGLGDAVSGLAASGTLDHGAATSLQSHLDNALRLLAAGHTHAARAQLESFIAEVESLVADGSLTAAEAAPLLAAAERALAGIS